LELTKSDRQSKQNKLGQSSFKPPVIQTGRDRLLDKIFVDSGYTTIVVANY
jgi:hypothetical protein